MLFGVRPLDAWTWFVVVGLVIAVALVASLIPAVRATRNDPVINLRAD
jgi:ABC-type antimicrobial peptide transport system permease subunit